MIRASIEHQKNEKEREKIHIHLKLIGNGFSVCFIILSWTWQKDSVCCRKEVLLCCTLEAGKTYWYTRKARCCAHSEERKKKVEREINKKLRYEKNWDEEIGLVGARTWHLFPTFFLLLWFTYLDCDSWESDRIVSHDFHWVFTFYASVCHGSWERNSKESGGNQLNLHPHPIAHPTVCEIKIRKIER